MADIIVPEEHFEELKLLADRLVNKINDLGLDQDNLSQQAEDLSSAITLVHNAHKRQVDWPAQDRNEFAASLPKRFQVWY